MSTPPRVSVVIPNYNYARFLDQRFRSILDQTRRDVEIIFLDDASTDESVELARRSFGAHIDRFETSERNSGNPFVQWNRGARLARGEYLWIAEADDFCAPEFLERMLAAMARSDRIGLAYCRTVPVDTAGNVLDEHFHQRYVADLDPHRWEQDFASEGLAEVHRFLARKNTITNVSSVLFRRQAYLDSGLAPEDLRMCGDWLTYLRVLHDWDVAYVARPMNFHRQHPAKHTQNSVLDLTYFREFLFVQDYVARAFNLNPSERAAALRRFLGEWDRLTVSHYGRIGLRRTLALARMAAAVYRGPPQRGRIAAHLLANASRSIAAKWLAP